MKKRQEIGRGVRLAVDQTGGRVYDEKVNVLTVVAEDAIDGTVEGVVFNMMGKIVNYDPGDWLAGTENSTVTLTITLNYLKIMVNGIVKHEIDVLNGKRIVNGVDQRAEINAALHAA